MNKIKLLDYQIHSIKSVIKYSYKQIWHSCIEDALLDKYKAWRIEDLNASDYNDIMDDIHNMHDNLKGK